MDVEALLDAIDAAGLPVERRREGLGTLRKLLTNIRDKPSEEKFRVVKKSNQVIQSKLFPQCLDILRAVGFRDEGDLLVHRADVSPAFLEALCLVESVVMSLGDAPAPTPSPAPASSSSSAPSAAPAQAKRTQAQLRAERAREETLKAQASTASQLASLRQERAGRYFEEQDAALARHLSGRDAERPYDAIAALNASREATHSFITCSKCGSSLRYNSDTRAQAVLCPCGKLLQPLHMKGQTFVPRSPSDLPVEPGEPVDEDNRPNATRGPSITVRGPDGEPRRMPLHAVLSMVRQNEGTRQTGAEGADIEALPTRKYESAQDSKTETQCQICIEDFEEGDELRTLPCFHLFHARCVDQWLKVNSICPTCRHKIG